MNAPTQVSHLTATQASRMVGVSQSAVTQRKARLGVVLVYDVEMIPVTTLRAWIKERSRRSPSTRAPHAKSTKRPHR